MQTNYHPGFYAGYLGESQTSAQVVAEMLTKMFQPQSAVDIGCGIGTWLCEFQKCGVHEVKGHDGAYVTQAQFLAPWNCFEALDLESPPKRAARRYDLAISMEVAEHLGAGSAEGFVDFLCSCSDVVVFSAAVPHQGGTDHRNEQWQSWWARKFLERDYAASDLVRRRIWGNASCAYYYQQNVVLYVKRSSSWIAKFPEAGWITKANETVALDVIHPAKWEQAHDPKSLGLARITRALPNALLMAAQKRLSR